MIPPGKPGENDLGKQGGSELHKAGRELRKSRGSCRGFEGSGRHGSVRPLGAAETGGAAVRLPPSRPVSQPRRTISLPHSGQSTILGNANNPGPTALQITWSTTMQPGKRRHSEKGHGKRNCENKMLPISGTKSM
ncbi:unnamed protein product [Rangifer tarandus platyrhynchus]|uniref:Uncharacterized protein n=2 Tax=Rangifer tarandus platyrhynchus TaxID=3082113 RepID=A0ACB0ETW2_RANTA|nr:unnamed protein product [Rangifer tarandus platyrhynchus]CAI9703984.1 unnamed protein product [Rangifer tarandus platyrhynchus]